MKTLKFRGYSDDIFDVEGTGPSELGEVPVSRSDFAVVKVEINGKGLHVTAIYSPRNWPLGNGCWTLGVCQLDEDVPLPEWPMRWSADRYSTVLELDVPDNTRVSLVEED